VYMCDCVSTFRICVCVFRDLLLNPITKKMKRKKNPTENKNGSYILIYIKIKQLKPYVICVCINYDSKTSVFRLCGCYSFAFLIFNYFLVFLSVMYVFVVFVCGLPFVCVCVCSCPVYLEIIYIYIILLWSFQVLYCV
jgi:hypothetical protein